MIGAICGGLYAYYTEHLANKNQLARLGRQLPPDSSAILAHAVGATSAELAAVAAKFDPYPLSVATVSTDLSATVLKGRTLSPAGRSISARRLNSIRPILSPDTSMVLARAVGAPQERPVTAWSAPSSEQVILRFESAPHGAVLDV